jgi:glycosyltransferase involved in cell wall biosynthesis
MIKICFIIQSFHIGGTEACIYNIASSLKDFFEFHFITTGNPDIHPKFTEIGNAVYLGEKWNKVINYLKTHQIDILQYGNLPEYKNCALKAKVPVIIERIAGPRSLKADHAGITHLISSSYGMVPAIRKTYSGPLTVIHNGVNLNKTIPRRYFDKNDFVVLYPCSRLGRGQKVDDAIKAVIKAHQQNSRIKLIITGGRPNQKGYENTKPKLQKLARPLGKNCIFTGFVDNMPEIIAGADVCIITAQTHGISNALIESCAERKSLIATNVGQTSEICHHGKNGYLIRVGDINQLAKYILYLSNTPTVCNKFGDYGYELIEKGFNLKIQAEKYKQLYENLSIICKK